MHEALSISDPFEAELLKHREYLLRYARSLAGFDGDDIFQETLAKALEERQTFISGTNMFAWLARILKNKNRDRYRNQLRRREVSYNESEEEAKVLSGEKPNYLISMEISADLSVDLKQRLLALPSEQLSVLTLWIQGFSYIEIAKKLKTPEGTVKARAYAGIKSLQETFEVNKLQSPSMLLIDSKNTTQSLSFEGTQISARNPNKKPKKSLVTRISSEQSHELSFLQHLLPGQREVIVRRLNGEDYSEIAEALNISVVSARNWYTTAIRLLDEAGHSDIVTRLNEISKEKKSASAHRAQKTKRATSQKSQPEAAVHPAPLVPAPPVQFVPQTVSEVTKDYVQIPVVNIPPHIHSIGKTVASPSEAHVVAS